MGMLQFSHLELPEPGEGIRRGPPPGTAVVPEPWQHLDFDIWVSRPLRKYISIFLSLPVYNVLLHKP